MQNIPKYRLFIPGPVNVSDRVYAAMNQGLIGHRSPEFEDIYKTIQLKLRPLFGTQSPVFLSTSSSWGGMEAAVINCCQKRVLNCMAGAFSDKWHDVSLRNERNATALQFEWGQAIDPEAIRKELQTGKYDAITLVHNETSTGTLNSLGDIMAVVREFPDVLSIVDTVSSFSTMPMDKDALGIDVMITGTQKALALPPGLCLIAVSQKALTRAKATSRRGYYFDFIEFLDNHEKNFTIATPAISIIYGLLEQLTVIEEEGLQNRFDRHTRLNNKVRSWAKGYGLGLFPQEEYASRSMSCIKNTQNIDILELGKALKERHHCIIDVGYGKLKGKTFRISNMGNETDESMDDLLRLLNPLIEEFKK